jgi:hypothetical protein
MATVINWLNPEKIIVYLPDLLRSYAWQKAGQGYIEAMRDAVRQGSFSANADTAIEELFFSLDQMEEICARAAAGLVLEAIVEDVELQEGHAAKPDRGRRRRPREPSGQSSLQVGRTR